MPEAQPKRWHLVAIFIGLFVISAGLLFYRLQEFPFADYDEAIYAQVITDTSYAHQFLTLNDLGSSWFHKPPLYFWLATGVNHIVAYPELSYRIPAAVAGLICVGLIVLIALELSGSAYVGALAGVLLISTGGFVEAARQVRLDVPVLAAILFSIYCYIRAKKDARWLIGIVPAIAVGILFKSIIGTLGIPLMLIWSFIERDFSWLRNRNFWIGTALGALILLPWHIYETYLFGMSFWNVYLFQQVLDRFGTDVNGGSISNWQYTVETIKYASPQILVFLVSIGMLFWRKLWDKRLLPVLVFVLSCIFVFLLFGIAKTKIFYYLLPAFALMSVSNALLMERVYRSSTKLWQKRVVGGVIALVILAGLANSVYIGFHLQKDFSIPQQTITDEHAIGFILAKAPPMRVRMFQDEYWDTVRYYSNEKDSIRELRDGDTKSTPSYIVISAKLYNAQPFAPYIMSELSPIYIGNSLALLKFTPKPIAP